MPFEMLSMTQSVNLLARTQIYQTKRKKNPEIIKKYFLNLFIDSSQSFEHFLVLHMNTSCTLRFFNLGFWSFCKVGCCFMLFRDFMFLNVVSSEIVYRSLNTFYITIINGKLTTRKALNYRIDLGKLYLTPTLR